MEDISSLFAKLLAILLVVFLLVALTIVVRFLAADARRRGKSPFLVVLLCFLSFPLGLIAWLIFRPEPVNRRGRELRQEDHRVQ
jgi:hypothetical protein